jgi:hypothetical protein
MSCSISQTVTTTSRAAYGSDQVVDDVRTDTTLSIPSDCRTEISLLGNSIEFETRPLASDGAVDWNNPERENIRVEFYGVSTGAIASAVVQYVAQKHNALTSNYCGPNEKAEAAAILARIAGAMGLSSCQFTTTAPKLPGEA